MTTSAPGPQPERSGRPLLTLIGVVLAVLVIVGVIFVVIGRSQTVDPAPAAGATTSAPIGAQLTRCDACPA